VGLVSLFEGKVGERADFEQFGNLLEMSPCGVAASP